MLATTRLAAALAACSILSGAALAASPAEILAANRAATTGWDGRAAVTADYDYAGQGMTGKSEETDDLKTGRWVSSYAIGPLTGADGFDGKEAWSKDQSGTVTIQNGGEQRALAVNQAYRVSNGWWRPDFGGAAVEALGTRSVGGAVFDALKITPKGGTAFEAWFDAKTHLLARLLESHDGRLQTTTLSDYRSEAEALMPGKLSISIGDAKYDQTLTLTGARFAAMPADGAFAAPAGKVNDFAIAGGTQTSLPFRLINNHIYAEVGVDGTGPYTFIFDTGGVNLLTPPLAQQLGLKSEGAVEASGAGEGHMQASFAKVQSLSLGKATIKDQTFFVLPLNTMEKIEGVDMPGMVGFETFRRFVTRIDYGRHVLTLIDPAAFDPKGAGVAVPIAFNGNMIEVNAKFDGIEGNFTIDTGNRGTLDVNTPFVAKHDLRAKAGKGVEAVSGWGVGGPSRAFVSRAGTLELAGFRLERLVTDYSLDTGGAMADPAMAGNIGAGLLKRFVVTFDYGHRTMYLKRIKGPVDDLDSYDRAGMWINLANTGFEVVAVTADSPAEKAGLAKGDVITEVDGKPAAGIRLYDLRQRLRDDKPGTVVDLTVTRGGKSQTVKVTLADQI